MLIFGPRRLPELGHTLGKCVRNFKEAMSGIEEAKFRHLDSSSDQARGGPVAESPKTVGASEVASQDQSGKGSV